MIKSILKVGLLLVVGILGYNYFLGSPEEKAQSKEILNKAADVGKAGVGLLKEEIGKFKSGKYDDALDKVGNALNKTKEKVKEGSKLLDQVQDWQTKKDEWTKKSDDLKDSMKSDDGPSQEETKKAINQLNEEAKALEKEGKRLEKEMEKEES